MRRFVALGIAAVVAMLLQTTLFPVVPGLVVVPDLILILVVYLGVRERTVAGAAAAFLLGYFLDTFSGTLLGLNAFALTATYLGVQWVARHLWVQRGLPVVAMVLFAALVRDAAALAVSTLVAVRVPVWHDVLGYGFAGALAAAVVAPAVFAAVAWEERLLGLS
jgi:rod shape-determining protein MreD